MYNMVDAIMQFGATEKLTGDAWQTLVTNVQESITHDYDVKAVLKNAEKEFKERTSKQLPGAWRSAKSVVLRALKNGINLVDEQGPLGKTAIEKKLKGAKAPPVVNETDRIEQLLSKVEELIYSADVPIKVALIYKLKEFAVKF